MTIHWRQVRDCRIATGDCRAVLPTLEAESVNCCVTSPPYFGLRDYGFEGQIGLERTVEEYVATMVEVFREVRRVLKPNGTLWLNLGDSYAGSWGAQSRGDWTPGTLEGASGKDYCLSARQILAHPKGAKTGSRERFPGLKPKDLCGIPWRVALALQADGWWLRQDIIWAKANPMPSSAKDRCTPSHEYLFLLTKSARYYFDWQAIAEPCEEPNSARPRMGQGANTQYAQKRKEWKTPDGWDTSTGEGGHGSFHKEGREKGKKGYKHKSGNKERKPASEREKPSGNDAGSVPWEGDKRIKRDVWTVPIHPFPGAHFATFPPALIRPAILAGCPVGGTVLDPFGGAMTTALVALELGCHAVMIEANPKYIDMGVERLASEANLFGAGVLAS